MDIQRKRNVADLLLALEQELRQLALWEEAVPPVEHLMSQEPFACDVMSLTSWLQWVFIPRMKALIESDADLPLNSNITAYAEEAWKGMSVPTNKLISIVVDIDKSLSTD